MSHEVPYTADFVRLELLVGQDLHYADAQRGETVVLTEPQRFTADSVLNGVITALANDMAAATSRGEMLDRDRWMPDDDTSAAIYEAHRPHLRYLRGVAGLRTYVQEIEDGSRTFDESPYDHQIETLREGARHLDSITPFAGVSQGAYADLAGGSGKSRVISMMAEGFKLVEDENDPNRICIIASDSEVQEELIGADGLSGLGRYAPDIETGKVNKDSKEWDKEVVVVTRAMAARVLDSDPEALNDFDLIIIDEAHTALAKQIRAGLEQVKTSMIGVTGSPNWSYKRRLDQLLPTRLTSHGSRELIEADKLSPVQLWVAKTDHVIAHTGDSPDFTPGELRQIAALEGRSQIAIDAALAFLRDGRNGAISCCTIKEAEEIAKILNGLTIVTNDGQTRHLRVVPVHGKTNNNHETFRALDADEVQAVTIVDIFTGWNVNSLSFLVNNRPSLSDVLASQRFARPGRRYVDANGQLVTAQIFDIVDIFRRGTRGTADELVSPRRQILTGQLLGEKVYEPGLVIASPATEGQRRDFRLDMFPEHMRRSISMTDGVPLRRLPIFGAGIRRERSPEDHISLIEAAHGLGTTVSRVRVAMATRGVQLKDGQYLSESSVGRIEDYLIRNDDPIVGPNY